MIKELAMLLQTYGGWGVAAVMLCAWWWERRENRFLTTQIIEMVREGSTTAEQLTRAIEGILPRTRTRTGSTGVYR